VCGGDREAFGRDFAKRPLTILQAFPMTPVPYSLGVSYNSFCVCVYFGVLQEWLN